LAGIALLSKCLAKKLETESHPSAKAAADIAATANNAIDSARRLAKGLYPLELSRKGLIPALEELANQTSLRFGVFCGFRQTGEAPIFEMPAAIHIYRIVQEAIGNAIKHGEARRIAIESLAGTSVHTFSVTDDGRGFAKPATTGGMGLHLMDYRARAIGALINVSRPAEGGCRVTCQIPV